MNDDDPFDEMPHPILREDDLDWIEAHGGIIQVDGLSPATIAMLVVDMLTGRGYAITPPSREVSS